MKVLLGCPMPNDDASTTIQFTYEAYVASKIPSLPDAQLHNSNASSPPQPRRVREKGLVGNLRFRYAFTLGIYGARICAETKDHPFPANPTRILLTM